MTFDLLDDMIPTFEACMEMKAEAPHRIINPVILPKNMDSDREFRMSELEEITKEIRDFYIASDSDQWDTEVEGSDEEMPDAPEG